MRKFFYVVISVFVLLFFTGCSKDYKIDTPVTVENVEITKQPLTGKTTIILKMVDGAGNHMTLVSLGASENEQRIIKCAKKGDHITVSFCSSGTNNIFLKAIKNNDLGIECQ